MFYIPIIGLFAMLISMMGDLHIDVPKNMSVLTTVGIQFVSLLILSAFFITRL